MTVSGWLQIALMLIVVVGSALPLGRFIAAVFEGRRNFLSPVLQPLERRVYGLAGVDPQAEQSWLP
jgi:K+-transporting ATPase ATPase A chain